MSKVLLFSPPYIDTYGGLDIEKIGWGIPPAGLGFIAAYLKSKNIDVRIFDLMFAIRNLNDIREIIQREKPEIIGIGSTSPQFKSSLMIAEIIKECDANILVVMGGPHSTSMPLDVINRKAIDITAVGDGEITMLEICQGKPFNQIKGIYYKDNGKPVFTGDREILMDIDQLPFPLYEQLPMDKYSSFYFGKSMGIISGRGCPFNCTFCASKIIDKGIFRFRSSDNILKELNYLYDNYGFKKFSFWDDTFTLKKDRITELCSKLSSNPVKFKWTCNTHINTVSDELLKTMAESGCKIIHLGVESGNEKILKSINKNISVEKIGRAVDWAHKYGIIVYGFFMIGLPGETEETVMQTINVSISKKIDLAQFSLLTPLPGTEIWDKAEKGEGLKFATSDLDKFLRYGNAVIELPDIEREKLNVLFSLAYKKFYLRPFHLFKLSLKFITILSPLHCFRVFLSFIRFFRVKL